ANERVQAALKHGQHVQVNHQLVAQQQIKHADEQHPAVSAQETDPDQEILLMLPMIYSQTDESEVGGEPGMTATPTAVSTPSPMPTPTETPAPTQLPTATPIPAAGGFPNGAEILPLGDSRVAGERPQYESYRYELWKNLLDNGWTFDFVGGQVDNASYDDYLGQAFDRDHEGVGGATSSDTLQTVIALLEGTGPTNEGPDIVLLGIGGNDYLEGGRDPDEVLANVNQIVDLFQEANPDVTIFIEQIAPAASAFMFPQVQETFDTYNAAILDLASTQTNQSSSVIAVDMATDWSDAYLADPVHYNEIGAKVVADRYDAAMEAHFND
ncbi:MAG: GDSL-type esterase/lipase family protein, partial [Chloroflexota bacterium]